MRGEVLCCARRLSRRNPRMRSEAGSDKCGLTCRAREGSCCSAPRARAGYLLHSDTYTARKVEQIYPLGTQQHLHQPDLHPQQYLHEGHAQAATGPATHQHLHRQHPASSADRKHLLVL
ncbi:hypothetical protein FKM82_008574 [Ascaphus truei]